MSEAPVEGFSDGSMFKEIEGTAAFKLPMEVDVGGSNFRFIALPSAEGTIPRVPSLYVATPETFDVVAFDNLLNPMLNPMRVGAFKPRHVGGSLWFGEEGVDNGKGVTIPELPPRSMRVNPEEPWDDPEPDPERIGNPIPVVGIAGNGEGYTLTEFRDLVDHTRRRPIPISVREVPHIQGAEVPYGRLGWFDLNSSDETEFKIGGSQFNLFGSSHGEGSPGVRVGDATVRLPEGEVISIGRSRENTLSFPNDRTVSKFQARLFIAGDRVLIKDGGTNRIQVGSHQ